MWQQVNDYLTAEKWPVLFQTVEAWSRLPKVDRAKIVALLTPAIADCKRVPLQEVEDLIIPYRVAKGDLKFQGHGLVVRQDLFTAGGRAAWAIGRLLEVDLPELHGGLTVDEWNTRVADIASRIKKASKSE
ncbi:MAG TPA: hypothetical protein VNK04_00885 [Gemmataceae bacterium]|nr:hypothetical protein [Gemmataceae bacterium]